MESVRRGQRSLVNLTEGTGVGRDTSVQVCRLWKPHFWLWKMIDFKVCGEPGVHHN
jgi:hypothetical protein